jgi:tetratricopeptide (TPR) repeat protein
MGFPFPRWAVWILALAVSMAPAVLGPTAPRVLAEESEPSGYRPLLADALREFEAGNYEEARALFIQAHSMMPTARTHRAIGSAEFELRNYGECIRHLEASLASNVRPLDEKLRKQTEQALARARRFVGQVVIETKPPTSEIMVDGIPVESGRGEPLVLKLGEHVIEAEAPGHIPEKRSIHLRGGEKHTVTIVFRSVAEHENVPVARGSKDSRRWYKSPWLWTAVGVVAAGAAAGTAIALTSSDGKVAAAPRGNTNMSTVAP